MANTVSSLSYANTFGDWMVATNDLVIENNILAKENYVKDSGTLYLSENSQTALQSNGNVIVSKVFSVTGIGSSATIQNNLDVQGQGYFSNGNLSLATTGTANVGNVLNVLGSDTALRVANNSRFGGNISVVYGTFTETLQANNSVNTSNASIYNTLYSNRIQSNTSVLTGTLSANNKVYTNDVQANTSILTSTIQANTHVTTTSVGVSGTAWVNVLQANTSTNTANASVIHTLWANVVQANISTNTRTASVTGTTFTDVLQANTSSNTSNASVIHTLYANVVQANISTNTRTASVTGTTFTNVLQANTSANTDTLSVYGTTFTDVLQANTSTRTVTASVSGTTFTDVLQANTSANTRTLSVYGTTFTDILQANSATNTANASIVWTVYANVVQANISTNTRTASVTGTTFTNVLQANSSTNTANASVIHTLYANTVQANLSSNTSNASVVWTLYANTVQANNTVNTTNVWATTIITANTLYANNNVYTPNITVTRLLDASLAEVYAKSLQVENDFGIGGNFVINGKTVYNVNEFTLSQNSRNQTSYFRVYRTIDGTSGTAAANAAIRWNEAENYFDINDVGSTGAATYYRIITEQQISDSISTTDGTKAASLTAAKTLNDNTNQANTWLRSRSDSASLYANGAFRDANSASTYANGAFGAANSASSYANSAFAAANNVGPQIAPAFAQANAAFGKANAATAEIKGTRGSISPTSASLTFTSNNGIAIHATGANTLAISTSQDLQTTASPSFTGLTLTGTPLSTSSGGTGSTSAAAAFNTLVAGATGTASGTSGYVLATGGSGNFYWTAAGAGGAGTQPGTRITSNRLSYTGDGTTTTFVTPTFSQANQVRVYINGVRQLESEYTLDASRVTMTVAPVVNDKILVEVDGYAVYEYFANNITYGPATGALTTGTIQSAIDSLESGKMPKTGGTFTGQVIGQTIDKATANTSLATGTYVHNLANSGWTFTSSITGNAGTVTNGVYTTGTYANPSFITSLNADKLSGGTIGSAILGNSSLFVGTSAIALNRASAAQTLNGVSISGNAGTVGNLSVHSGRNNEANKIVRTDVNGYILAGYINSSSGNENNASNPPRVWGTNGSDDYMRTYQTGSLSVGYAASAGSAGHATTSDSATTAGTFGTNRTNYKGTTDGAVAGQMMWKNYGNGHTIFDASNGTSPGGQSVDNTNAAVPWAGTYPTLMGWNGSSTYGVRVDSARVADSAGTATYATGAGSATSASSAGLLNPLSGPSDYKLGYTADGARTNAGEWGRVVMRYAPNGQTYGVRVDRADYADSAGSAGSATNSTNATYGRYVYNNGAYSGSGWIEASDLGVRYAASAPWSGISGRPTAVSSFTNDSGYLTSSTATSLGLGTSVPNVVIITSTQNFTVPSGVTRLRVVCIGGGGGGAYLEATPNIPTMGGAGGAGEALITVTPGQSIYCTIGTGGAQSAQVFPYAGGSAGGSTSFGSYITATGGAGGYITYGPQYPIYIGPGSASFGNGAQKLSSSQILRSLYGGETASWSGAGEGVATGGGGGLNGGNGAGATVANGPGDSGTTANRNGGSGGIIIFY